jgi:Flp pilus assembly protein TadD
MHARSWQVLGDHAERLLVAGDASRARRVFQLACLGAPLEAAPWIGLGLCQQRLGETEAAVTAFAMAQALGADHPAISLQEATCLGRLGDRSGARTKLTETLRMAETRNDEAVAVRARAALEWLSAGEKRQEP